MIEEYFIPVGRISENMIADLAKPSETIIIDGESYKKLRRKEKRVVKRRLTSLDGTKRILILN